MFKTSRSLNYLKYILLCLLRTLTNWPNSIKGGLGLSYFTQKLARYLELKMVCP